MTWLGDYVDISGRKKSARNRKLRMFPFQYFCVDDMKSGYYWIIVKNIKSNLKHSTSVQTAKSQRRSNFVVIRFSFYSVKRYSKRPYQLMSYTKDSCATFDLVLITLRSILI